MAERRRVDDAFGISVAIDGDTIVVGSYGGDIGTNSGSAYVFRTSDGGATYVEVAKLTAADAAAGDEFGRSVAIDGDTIVVGANHGRRPSCSSTDGGTRAQPTSSARATAAPRTTRWPS